MDDVNEYFSKLPDQALIEFNRIGKNIKLAVPKITIGIKYGVPSYIYKNKMLIGFGYYKNHMSLFPASSAIEFYKKDLRYFEVSKGTIRYGSNNLVPDILISNIAHYNKQQLDEK